MKQRTAGLSGTWQPFLFSVVLLFTACFICLMLTSGFAAPPPKIKVSVLSKYAPQEIIVRGADGILFAENQQIKTGGLPVRIKLAPQQISFEIKGKPRVVNSLYFSFPKTFTVQVADVQRFYSGSLSVTHGGGELLLVVRMNTEEYIAAAARSELGELLAEKPKDAAADWKRELIAAMEITIRSWLAAQPIKHVAKDYDICDLTHCVHFAGLPAKGVASISAGRIMLDKTGKPFEAFFHSSCGGVLTGPEVYWRSKEEHSCFRRGGDHPEARLQPDAGKPADLSQDKNPWCAASPHFNWTREVSSDEMSRITNISDLVEITPEYREGRVSSLVCGTVFGEQRLVSVSAFLSKAGRLLGWNAIKSNMFNISKTAKGWLLAGRGLGHGVGLCQWGAAAQAKAGKKASDILSFYYNSPIISD